MNNKIDTTKIRMLICGSIKIKTLNSQVIQYLNQFMRDNVLIVLGDAPGVDALIQSYLAQHKYKRVEIFTASETKRTRFNLGNWRTIVVEGDYTSRDKVMCDRATHGLAIWNGQSKGTKRNIDHLRKQRKQIEVIRLKPKSSKPSK